MHITGISFQHISIGPNVLWAVNTDWTIFFGTWADFTVPYERPTEDEVPTDEVPAEEEETISVEITQVEGALV